MLNVNIDRYHTTKRTATSNRPVFLAGAAGLEKYDYDNGFTVMERISGTVILCRSSIFQNILENIEHFQSSKLKIFNFGTTKILFQQLIFMKQKVASNSNDDFQSSFVE